MAGQLQQQESADHLVAVIGVGLSNDDTATVAKLIAAWPQPVPMIGTVDTADGLNSTLFGGTLTDHQWLARVEPTTGNEVSLLKQYLASKGPLPTTLLVWDNSSNDWYTRTLRIDFTDQFHPTYTQQYSPGYGPGQFGTISNEVCPGGGSPLTILFAGRETVFKAFLDQLRQQTNCPKEDTITVVTGQMPNRCRSARPRITPVAGR